MTTMLVQAMFEGEEERKAKEAIRREKDDIVRDFTHTYKNMKATTLYDVAQSLLRNADENVRQSGRSVLLEYVRKESLTKEIYMMDLKYQQDTAKLRQVLRRSCLARVGTAALDTIRDVLHQALLMSWMRVIYDPGKRVQHIRRRVAAVVPITDDVVRACEQHVIFAGDGDCFAWLVAQGFPWDVTVSEGWQAMGFLRGDSDNYAEVFLRDALADLYKKVFKYADLRQPVHLAFGETVEALTVTLTGALPAGKQHGSDALMDLKEFARLLAVLWGDSKTHVRSSYAGGTFTIAFDLVRRVFEADAAAGAEPSDEEE